MMHELYQGNLHRLINLTLDAERSILEKELMGRKDPKPQA
jgi:hypothetical protein